MVSRFNVSLYIFIKLLGIKFSLLEHDQMVKSHVPKLELTLPMLTTLTLKTNKFRPFRWTKDDFVRFHLSGTATAKSVLQ